MFALYDERDASTPLWSEVHSITFEDGFFSVRLGSIVPFGRARWGRSGQTPRLPGAPPALGLSGRPSVVRTRRHGP
ncbi:hypothetical protein [Sorangium sp. So ce204]|uniref:hypothetical protein n=1 Tax=Sorangium sp. So ce204 TaxID=3133288 RepID=UPI003F631675